MSRDEWLRLCVILLLLGLVIFGGAWAGGWLREAVLGSAR